MGGIRNEIRGPPGGRTRYPITMRRIKLDDPMATRAIINTIGVIVRGFSLSYTNCHGNTLRVISRLIKQELQELPRLRCALLNSCNF